MKHVKLFEQFVNEGVNEISTQVPAKMVGMDILGDDEEDEEMAGPMGTVGYLGIDEGKKLKGWNYTGTISYGSGKRGIYYQYPNNIKYYVEVTPEEYDDYLEGGSLKKKLEKKWADSGRAMSQDEFRRKYPLKGMNKYLSQGGRMWD